MIRILSLAMEMIFMCTRFYVEPAQFAPPISRAQKLKLADDMMRYLIKPLTMSGELHPTDVAAVLASNKNVRMLVNLSRIIEDDYVLNHRKIQSKVDKKLKPLIQKRKQMLGIKSDGRVKKTLLFLPPLITLSESFPSYGSSLFKSTICCSEPAYLFLKGV